MDDNEKLELALRDMEELAYGRGHYRTAPTADLKRMIELIEHIRRACDNGNAYAAALAAIDAHYYFDKVYYKDERILVYGEWQRDKDARGRSAAAAAEKARTSDELKTKMLAEYDRLLAKYDRQRLRNKKTLAKTEAADKCTVGVRTLEKFLRERERANKLFGEKASGKKSAKVGKKSAHL